MRTTGDQFLVKKINKSIILDLIIQKSPISRAQISEMTGLTKATVSSLVNEWIESHLIYEIGPGPSSGGRKPVMLLFQQAAGYSIGVDLGVNYILTVLTDLRGEIIAEKIVPLHVLAFSAVLDVLKKSIHEMIGQAPPSPYGIVGIGIGVPGITDDKGVILFAPNLGWENIDLRSAIHNEFGLPVAIENEANAGVMGEKRFGTGKEVSNVIYVSVGIGIGTGIIINNELFRGSSGFSGEMGHFTIELTGKKCRCGNFGCWELYASESAILEQAKALPQFQNLQDGFDNVEVDISLLEKLAKEGHAEVIQLFQRIGEYLGIGLANIINMFNPELVIIGNRLTTTEKWLFPAINRVVANRALPFHRKNLRIEFSHLGTHSTALGGSFIALSHFFSETKGSLQ